VKSLKRVALSRFAKDIRQLLLVDNMAVALCFDRFRSRKYRLLRQIRRYSSYLLACVSEMDSIRVQQFR
jgi:hypothetical protein